MIQGLSGDYEMKLEELGLTTLEERRSRGDMIQTFKIIRGIDNVNYETWFRFTSQVNIRDSRAVSEAKLAIPMCYLNVRKHFFSVRVPNQWNEIPNSFRQNVDVVHFKIGYDEFKREEKKGGKFYVI